MDLSLKSEKEKRWGDFEGEEKRGNVFLRGFCFRV